MRTTNTTLNLTSLANRLANNKWLLNANAHDKLCAHVDHLMQLRAGGLYGKIMGDPLTYKMAEGINNNATTNEVKAVGNTAIVPISGVLMKGVSQFECELLGLTNIDDISDTLDELADDPTVENIICVFASPGGETIGIEELARKIASIDSRKPCFGWTELYSCSASYWLMSMCRVIGMTNSSLVGSIGVYMMIVSMVEAMKQQGVIVTPVSSGKYKLIGNEMHNITDEELAILQADVTKQHDKFKQTILSKRPQVKPDCMEGLTYEGEDAKINGLIDIVCDSFKEFLDTIQK